MIPPEHMLVTGISQFLLESRPDVFTSWPVLTMHQWIRHHLRQRAVATIAVDGRIVAVGIGWRGHMGDLDDRWSAWDDSGDCFYFDQLHSRDASGLAALITMFEFRVPDWKRLKLIADRRGRRVQLHPRILDRLKSQALAKDQ